MATNFRRSAAPLITAIQKLFSEDLAKENDFLRQENKILRGKLGKRVPLTEADRRTLVRYGLHQGAPGGGHDYCPTRNAAGLEPPDEAAETDLRQHTQASRPTLERKSHRGISVADGRGKRV